MSDTFPVFNDHRPAGHALHRQAFIWITFPLPQAKSICCMRHAEHTWASASGFRRFVTFAMADRCLMSCCCSREAVRPSTQGPWVSSPVTSWPTLRASLACQPSTRATTRPHGCWTSAQCPRRAGWTSRWPGSGRTARTQGDQSTTA